MCSPVLGTRNSRCGDASGIRETKTSVLRHLHSSVRLRKVRREWGKSYIRIMKQGSAMGRAGGRGAILSKVRSRGLPGGGDI